VLVSDCVRPPACIYCLQLPWISQGVAPHILRRGPARRKAVEGRMRVMGFLRGLPHTAFFRECIVMIFLYLMLQCVSLFLAVPVVLPCGAAKLRGRAKMSVNDGSTTFGRCFS